MNGDSVPGRDPTTPAADHEITLSVPFSPRFASVIRVATAAVGADLGFDVDELDDLRLGIDEAVSACFADARVEGERLCIRLAVGPSTLTARIAVEPRRRLVERDDVDELALRVLRTVVDSFEFTEDEIILTKSVRADHP